MNSPAEPTIRERLRELAEKASASGDWATRRAELTELWSGKGMYPMTDFEMYGAVQRDAKAPVAFDERLGDDPDDPALAYYDRRGLLNLVWTLITELNTLERRAIAAEEALRSARFVAEHWRDAYLRFMKEPPASTQWAIGTHPLNLVLAAMDGERDPINLGIDEGSEARTALEASRGWSSSEEAQHWRETGSMPPPFKED